MDPKEVETGRVIETSGPVRSLEQMYRALSIFGFYIVDERRCRKSRVVQLVYSSVFLVMVFSLFVANTYSVGQEANMRTIGELLGSITGALIRFFLVFMYLSCNLSQHNLILFKKRLLYLLRLRQKQEITSSSYRRLTCLWFVLALTTTIFVLATALYMMVISHLSGKFDDLYETLFGKFPKVVFLSCMTVFQILEALVFFGWFMWLSLLMVASFIITKEFHELNILLRQATEHQGWYHTWDLSVSGDNHPVDKANDTEAPEGTENNKVKHETSSHIIETARLHHEFLSSLVKGADRYFGPSIGLGLLFGLVGLVLLLYSAAKTGEINFGSVSAMIVMLLIQGIILCCGVMVNESVSTLVT